MCVDVTIEYSLSEGVMEYISSEESDNTLITQSIDHLGADPTRTVTLACSPVADIEAIGGDRLHLLRHIMGLMSWPSSG